MQFFRDYEDQDHYFFLNYIEDVSGGLLYWPYYPPEEFKVLLYFPETDTYLTTETSIKRYALTSKFKGVFEDGTIRLTRNYDYLKLFTNTLIRTCRNADLHDDGETIKKGNEVLFIPQYDIPSVAEYFHFHLQLL